MDSLSNSFQSKFSLEEKRFYISAIISLISAFKQHTRWHPTGQTVAENRFDDHEFTQFYYPVSLYVDQQQIYIVSHRNNCIMKWSLDSGQGAIAVNGSFLQSQENEINSPKNVIFDNKTNSLIICDAGNRRVVQYSCSNEMKILIENIDCSGLAIDNQGYLYVSDFKQNYVQRWKIGEKKGVIVAGGHGQGSHRHQLDGPMHLFVDSEQSVYVSDYYNHRVMKWTKNAKEGIIVAGNGIEGNTLKQLSYPVGVVVDRFSTVYVADSNNHRVMCWTREARTGSIAVGGKGHGNDSEQLYCPFGLCLDRDNNLYVADSANHRVQKFSVDLTEMS